MINKKIEDLFQESFKRANEGDLFNYDIWLQENGINPRSLIEKQFFYHIRSNPNLMIDNEVILTKVAEYLGLFLKDHKGLYHFAIIGEKGTGKSLLLEILDNLTRQSVGTNTGTLHKLTNKNLSFINNIDFDEVQNSTDIKRGALQLIDDCEKVNNITNTIKYFYKAKGDAVYITSWTPESWKCYREEINDFLPINEIFSLPRLTLEETKSKFMKQLFDSIKLGSSKLNFPPFVKNIESIGEQIFNYSLGNHQISIEIFIESLKNVCLSTDKIFTPSIIKDTAEKKGYKDIESLISELSSQHLKILEQILLSQYQGGMRPLSLAKFFALDKSTITYHLNILIKKGILNVDKVGKSSFYKVGENYISYIQYKILEEFRGNGN